MKHWLIKSEPSVYSFTRLRKEGRTAWDGIRNFQARNNLAAMAPGDLCLFYHSNEEKAVVGLATVASAAYPEPGAADERWLAVDILPGTPFVQPVTLKAMKADSMLASMALIRQSRLSVCPLTEAEFQRVCALGGL